MWQRTGNVERTAFTGVTLENVLSDAGEGVAWEVVARGRVVGRVQEYTATIEAGRGLTRHGATWAITVLEGSKRWSTSRGQAIFGFATRADAVRHAVDNHV